MDFFYEFEEKGYIAIDFSLTYVIIHLKDGEDRYEIKREYMQLHTFK